MSYFVFFCWLFTLYVIDSGSITSVWESAIVYLLLCDFCSESLPLCAWDWLHYFIVALLEPSI